MSEARRLEGSVAMVTGAAQGIGAVYARALAAEGAAVALCDLIDPAPVVESIVAAGGRAWGALADAADASAAASFVAAVRKELGTVDILVNNAALFGGLPKKPFMEIGAEEWNRVLRINTLSVLECSKAVVPGMRARGRGKIINIASSTVHSGTPLLMHYVASKGAIIAMTRSMARELGDDGIAVNCLAPGLTLSEAVRRDTPQSVIDGSKGRRAFKREMQPEDLVGTLLYLAGAGSDFVTGQCVIVDGGGIMH